MIAYNQFQVHERMHIDLVGEHVCRKCNKTYASTQRLQRHVVRCTAPKDVIAGVEAEGSPDMFEGMHVPLAHKMPHDAESPCPHAQTQANFCSLCDKSFEVATEFFID